METEHPGESPGSIRLARRDQRSSIPRHAHAPAPIPAYRRWSIRCIAFALVTDGNLGPPLALRFRLRSAVRRCTLVSARLCAALRSSVPLPLAAPYTEASLETFIGGCEPHLWKKLMKCCQATWTSLARGSTICHESLSLWDTAPHERRILLISRHLRGYSWGNRSPIMQSEICFTIKALTSKEFGQLGQ